MEKKGYLLLEDGSLYEGVLRGAQKAAVAELVFNTAMVGYMETLTDPCYEGQMVVQTFPCIGNYGVVPVDGEQQPPRLAGYVAREISDAPCNFRCEGLLDDYLRENGVTCLTDVDTRALTRRLRKCGVMKAAILTEKPEDVNAAVAELKASRIPASGAVSTSVEPSQTKGLHHVVLWHMGAKADIQTELEKRGCAVTCVPASATAKEILALNPDGVVLTGGPGNPEDYVDVVQQLQIICEELLPVFGVGLGHQLLALSQGAQIIKLPYGHRGGNQSVKDVRTGQCYITSQNHGYAVDVTALPDHAQLRFVNSNDDTCEGLEYAGMPAFSVQFQPEPCGGPLDTRMLYDRFIALMGGNKECR